MRPSSKKMLISAQSHTFGTRPEENDYYRLRFIKWAGKNPTALDPVKMSVSIMIALAYKTLGSEHAKDHVAHLHLPDGELAAGQASWGPDVVKKRSRILSYSGQYGRPLPVSERDLFLSGATVTIAAIEVRYDPKDQTINLSGTEFTMQAIAEVFAAILRDKLTWLHDKRYYVPWLVKREESCFHDMFLIPGYRPPEKVRDWSPANVESDSPPANFILSRKCQAIQWSDKDSPDFLTESQERKMHWMFLQF